MHPMSLTEAGARDPVFGGLPRTFNGLCGHEDTVDRLPEGAVLLASSDCVLHQAYRFEGRPIYCTQFHPELEPATILERLTTYPRYVEEIAGVPFDVMAASLEETPECGSLLRRFVTEVFGLQSTTRRTSPG